MKNYKKILCSMMIMFCLSSVFYTPRSYALSIPGIGTIIDILNKLILPLTSTFEIVSLTKETVELQDDKNLQGDELTKFKISTTKDKLNKIDEEMDNLEQEEDPEKIDIGKLTLADMSGRRNKKDALRNAIVLQSIVQQNLSIKEKLDKAVSDSNSAVGQLQALQAGNRISTLSSHQMMNLQQIIAASERMKAVRAMEEYQREVRGRAIVRKIMKYDPDQHREWKEVEDTLGLFSKE